MAGAQPGHTYNGPIYLDRLNFLSGRAQQVFDGVYAQLGRAVDRLLSHYDWLTFFYHSTLLVQHALHLTASYTCDPHLVRYNNTMLVHKYILLIPTHT